MTESFSSMKARTLEGRLLGLSEEYEAANKQLSRTLSEVDRLRIQRQITDLETAIQKVEAELLQSTLADTTAAGGANATISSFPSPTQLRRDPADLYKRIHDALMQCQEFDSPQALMNFFAHPDLDPFRNLLQDATYRQARVRGVMAQLRHHRRRDGRHALVILLHTLSDAYSQDLTHQAELIHLADELKQALQDGWW